MNALTRSSVRLAGTVAEAIRERHKTETEALERFDAAEGDVERAEAAQNLLAKQALAARRFAERTEMAALRMAAMDEEHVVEGEAA